MKQKIAGVIEDLKAACEEGLAALNLLPQPQLPEEEKPHWLFAHLYDEHGKLKERGVK